LRNSLATWATLTRVKYLDLPDIGGVIDVVADGGIANATAAKAIRTRRRRR